VLANAAAGRLTARFLRPEAAAVTGGANVAWLVLHPEGIRPHVVNWDEAAAALLARLERELAERPGDEALEQLRDEVIGYPGVAELAGPPRLPVADDLLIPLHLLVDGVDLRLFTTITTIGAPYDVTLAELRLETLLPADPASEAVLRQLAESGE
jgi:hypothetical protein